MIRLLASGAITAIPHAAASNGSFGLPESMRSGMTLRDLVFVMDPPGGTGRQILRAQRAEVGDPPNWLEIEGLRLSGQGGANPFQLEAATATYDFESAVVRTRGGFRAEGFGFAFEGTELSGDAAGLVFDVPEFLQIRRQSVPVPAESPVESRVDGLQSVYASAGRSFDLRTAGRVTPIKLVQDFSGDLGTFFRCWRWVEDSGNQHLFGIPGPSVLVCPTGGRLDLKRNEMRLAGSSAMLGPRVVLISAGGIHLFQDEIDGASMVRVCGQGGIRGWTRPPAADECFITADTFEYVSDGQVLQFEGGPLALCRNGMTLQAVENWQFIRIFEGKRIVLSPGAWNMSGTYASRSE